EFVEWITEQGDKITVPYRKSPPWSEEEFSYVKEYVKQSMRDADEKINESLRKLEEKQDDTKQHDNEMYAMGKVMVSRNLAEQAINEAHSAVQQLTEGQALADYMSKTHDKIGLVTEQLETLARQIAVNEAVRQHAKAIELQQEQSNIIDEQIMDIERAKAFYADLAYVAVQSNKLVQEFAQETNEAIEHFRKWSNDVTKPIQHDAPENIAQEVFKSDEEDIQRHDKDANIIKSQISSVEATLQLVEAIKIIESNMDLVRDQILAVYDELDNNSAGAENTKADDTQEMDSNGTQHQQTEKVVQEANKVVEDVQKYAKRVEHELRIIDEIIKNDAAAFKDINDRENIAVVRNKHTDGYESVTEAAKQLDSIWKSVEELVVVNQQAEELADAIEKEMDTPIEKFPAFERDLYERAERMTPQDAKNKPMCTYLIAHMKRLTPSEELWNWTFDALKDACTEEFATKTRNFRELQLKITQQNASKYWMIHRDAHFLIVWGSWLCLCFFGMYMILFQ